MAHCDLAALLDAGFFIRAMECRAFNWQSKGSPAWNIRALNATMPDFAQRFRECADAEMHKPRAATSYLRHDLPLKSYADNFGYMIAATPDSVDCSYAFDSRKGWGRRPPCQIGVAAHVRRRYRVVHRACARRKDASVTRAEMRGLFTAQTDASLNCCFANMSDALQAQTRYAVLNHSSPCTHGSGLNQMQLRWSRADVFGVFYFRDSDLPFARQMHKIALASGQTARPLRFCKIESRRVVPMAFSR
eukprot:6601821-Prymnesium_polylepis.1